MDWRIAYDLLIDDPTYPDIVPGLIVSFDAPVADVPKNYETLRIFNDQTKQYVTKPPEQAFIDAFNAWEATQTAEDGVKQALVTAYQAIVGQSIEALDNAGLKLLVKALAYKAGAIDHSTLEVKPLGQWINNG